MARGLLLRSIPSFFVERCEEPASPDAARLSAGFKNGFRIGKVIIQGEAKARRKTGNLLWKPNGMAQTGGNGYK
jgi:hypothetical protein